MKSLVISPCRSSARPARGSTRTRPSCPRPPSRSGPARASTGAQQYVRHAPWRLVPARLAGAHMLCCGQRGRGAGPAAGERHVPRRVSRMPRTWRHTSRAAHPAQKSGTRQDHPIFAAARFISSRKACDCPLACASGRLGGGDIGQASAGRNHVQQMMVIGSPLSDCLALWSSHCQVKNRPIPPTLITMFCCFLWHVATGESLLYY